MTAEGTSPLLRRAVLAVAILNLAYFGVEFAMAIAIQSVSLFADSIDFLEDASINLLIVIALSMSLARQARVGMVLAGILLIPSVASLWMAWQKLSLPVPPEAIPLSITGFGALLVNFTCALILTRYRTHSGSLTRAAFLSARNDVFANALIIVAGAITSYIYSAWPDLIVGIIIAAMNAGAAKEVYEAARDEHRTATS